jgi:hypothetical protein
MIWRRFRANRSPLARWMNLIRALSSQKSGPRKYIETRNRLSTDRAFRAFYSGDSSKPPSCYLNQVKASLGPFYDHLPEKVVNYLKWGEPAQNPRTANTLPMAG